ncbi:MAG: SdrD B-like domain-containing protein [Deinococcaceae bacterium]
MKKHLLSSILILSAFLASCNRNTSPSAGIPINEEKPNTANSLKIIPFADTNGNGQFDPQDGESEPVLDLIHMQVSYKGGILDCYSGSTEGTLALSKDMVCDLDGTVLPDGSYTLKVDVVPGDLPDFLRYLINQSKGGWFNYDRKGSYDWFPTRLIHQHADFYNAGSRVQALMDFSQPEKLPAPSPSQFVDFKQGQPKAHILYYPLTVREFAPQPDRNGNAGYLESISDAKKRIKKALSQPYGHVRGQITDAQGNPLSNITVRGGSSQGVKTDQEGRFLLSYLTDGPRLPGGFYESGGSKEGEKYLSEGKPFLLSVGDRTGSPWNIIQIAPNTITQLNAGQMTTSGKVTSCIDVNTDGMCDLNDGKFNIAADLLGSRQDLPLPYNYVGHRPTQYFNAPIIYDFGSCENGLCYSIIPPNTGGEYTGDDKANRSDFAERLATTAVAMSTKNPVTHVYGPSVFVPPADLICSVPEGLNVLNKHIFQNAKASLLQNQNAYPNYIESKNYYPEVYNGDAIYLNSDVANPQFPCYPSGNFDVIPFYDANANGQFDNDGNEFLLTNLQFTTRSAPGNSRFNIYSYSRPGPAIHDPREPDWKLAFLNTVRTRFAPNFGGLETSLNRDANSAQIVATTPNTPQVGSPISHFASNSNIPFWGYAFPGTINVQIFEDRDQTKDFGSNDSPWANVTVRYRDRLGNVKDARTDAEGKITFSNVTPGSVQIEVLKATLPNSTNRIFTETSGSGFFKTVTLSSRGDLYVPFGYKVDRSGKLEGILFTDSNGNGAQDPDELGISGVTLTAIRNDVGNTVDREQRTTTGSNGKYVFDTVREGPTQIVIQDIELGGRADFIDGFNVTSPKDALHANDEFGKRVIAQTNVTGETNNTLNFGFQPHFIQPNISFFWDTNRNGVHNPDEPFIFLEDLALWNLTTPNLFTENNLNPLVRTKSRIPLNAMSHDLYFNYGLGRVVTGSNQPDFIKNTMFQITNGQKLGLSSGLFVPLIQIQPQAWTSPSLEIGLNDKQVTLSGIVFDDLNNNEQLDPGEFPLPGAIINTDLGNHTSGPKGQYQYLWEPSTSPRKVTYQGYDSSWSFDFSYTHLVSIFNRNNLGESTEIINLPIHLPRKTVSGHVFEDLNKNGSYDNEPSFSNVSLSLTDSLGQIHNLKANFDGSFSFKNIPFGPATLSVDSSSLPPNYISSLPLPASINISTTSDLNIDLPFTLIRTTGSIQGLVFNDLNNNGNQDSGEPGLPGILVRGQDLLEQFTDGSGSFEIPTSSRQRAHGRRPPFSGRLHPPRFSRHFHKASFLHTVFAKTLALSLVTFLTSLQLRCPRCGRDGLVDVTVELTDSKGSTHIRHSRLLNGDYRFDGILEGSGKIMFKKSGMWIPLRIQLNVVVEGVIPSSDWRDGDACELKNIK